MRHSVEAAGVHLADCTLLMYRSELERQIKQLENDTRPVTATSMNSATANESSMQRKIQEASPLTRIDGELISSNIAMTNAMHSDYMYVTAKTARARQQEARAAVCQLHDDVRATIIDEWALGCERIAKLERKHLQSAKYRERLRGDAEWRAAVAERHVADEAMLWAAEAQVLQREAEEGREAYRRSARALSGRRKIK